MIKGEFHSDSRNATGKHPNFTRVQLLRVGEKDDLPADRRGLQSLMKECKRCDLSYLVQMSLTQWIIVAIVLLLIAVMCAIIAIRVRDSHLRFAILSFVMAAVSLVGTAITTVQAVRSINDNDDPGPSDTSPCSGRDRTTVAVGESGDPVPLTVTINKEPPSGYFYWIVSFSMNRQPQGYFAKARIDPGSYAVGKSFEKSVRIGNESPIGSQRHFFIACVSRTADVILAENVDQYRPLLPQGSAEVSERVLSQRTV